MNAPPVFKRGDESAYPCGGISYEDFSHGERFGQKLAGKPATRSG